MEIVVAAPHSALRSSADQTPRMIGAVQTPGVHILGHPRGRMYGSRPGVTARLGARVRSPRRAPAWRSSSTAIPSRQDLDYDLARRAIAERMSVRHRQRRARRPISGGMPRPRWRTRASPAMPRDRVINCWPLAKLLDWAEQRSALRDG